MQSRSRSDLVSRRTWLGRAATVGGGLALFGCGPAVRAGGGPLTGGTPERAAPELVVEEAAWLADFRDGLIAHAREAADRPYVAPDARLPASLDALDYDAYRAIRFRPEESVWRAEGLPFQAQLFHRGLYSRERVEVRELSPEGERPIPFSPTLFAYPPEVRAPREGEDLGFAGLRLHAAMNRADYFDELLVVQGASYFRSLGQHQVYGLSARGLAIDTGEASGEEFPRFDTLWLVRPERGARAVRLFARLDGPRVSGAYELVVTPGAPTTTITVHAHVFLRAPVRVLGLAPLTSMYLFGEDRPARFEDWRPEVHDSDGLAMEAAGGERLFRPLANPPATRVTEHRLDDPRGFGLLQRDRALASYLDLETSYHRRPSAWVEPLGAWGPGRVRLLEIATQLETDDNIAAMWVPDEVPADGLAFAYRLHLGGDPGASASGELATVRATRLGAARTVGTPEASLAGARFVLDWTGGEARADAASGVEVVVSAGGAAVAERRVEAHAELEGLRTTFVVTPESEAPVELRAFLRRGERALSETWSYLWTPRGA